jgi:hypothetical protein
MSGQRPPDDAPLARGIEWFAPIGAQLRGAQKLKAPISGG